MKKLIPSKDLQQAIVGLSQLINNKCEKHGGGIVFVCVLKGGFMFFSDLVKEITIPVELDFIRCKSYYGRKQGDLVVSKDLETKIKNKHVYLVDDILDSGNTMKAVSKFLEVKEPKSITPVAAIYKESVDFDRVLHILYQDVDSIFDPWYIGYGMDDDKGHNRNLSTIYTI